MCVAISVWPVWAEIIKNHSSTVTELVTIIVSVGSNTVTYVRLFLLTFEPTDF